MTVVLEIGCGSDIGPRFDGASEQYAIDSNPEAVYKASLGRAARTIGLMLGDATHIDGFSDESVDIVLARNVFGDNQLNASPEHTEMERKMWALGQHNLGQDEMLDISATIESARDERKRQIIQESGRVLVTGGKLVIVEQYSPLFAQRFLRNLPRLSGGLLIARSTLEEATPANYAAARAHADVWVGRKVLHNDGGAPAA